MTHGHPESLKIQDLTLPGTFFKEYHSNQVPLLLFTK